MGQWDTEQIWTHCIDDDDPRVAFDSQGNGRKKKLIERKTCVHLFGFALFLLPTDINNKQIKMR